MNVNLDIDILENIKSIRLSKGYSQEYMASKLGIAQNNYGKLERGEINLTTKRLSQIGEIFDTTFQNLIFLGFKEKSEKIEDLVEKINELKQKVQNLEKQLENSIYLSDVEELENDVLLHSKNGKGLVYLDYDYVRGKFYKYYLPLKNKLSKKQFIDISSKRFEDTSLEDLEKDSLE